MTRHGPAPTTLRGRSTRRSITIHLSPAEYAAAEAEAAGEPMATWARGLVVRAVTPQMVVVDGGAPYALPAGGIIKGGASCLHPTTRDAVATAPHGFAKVTICADCGERLP